jgi:hypothetical protein
MTKSKGITSAAATKLEHDIRVCRVELAQQRKLLDELVNDVRAMWNSSHPHLQYEVCHGLDA